MLLPALLVVIAASPADARAILEKHECNRCHVIEDVAPPPVTKSCAGCHQEISSSATDPQRTAAGRKRYGAARNRFVDRTGRHYVNVPPLVSMERFRADWLRAFLRSPYDLRPNLTESMFRHALTNEEIDVLVAAWTRPRGPETSSTPDTQRIEAGARLFEQKGCATCHLFGSRFVTAVGTDRLRAMAPDLAHARDRYEAPTLTAILRDPAAVLSSAQMPNLGLTAEEASLLVDFLRFADPSPRPVSHRGPPAYDPRARVPTWEEVDRAVFRKVCWHCHSDPDFNGGDGGPGNTGGLGFAGAGLSFADYASFRAGSRGPDGKRQSVLRPGPSGEPVLLEVLRQRYTENAADHVGPGIKPSRLPDTGPRGMPLGLPALSPEDFSLIERWVKGGAPGPAN